MKQPQNRSKLPENAVWDTYSTQGVPTNFCHATSFPSRLYLPFLEEIAKHTALKAFHLRPTWPGIGEPPKERQWELFAQDLIAFIEQEWSEPIIGIGHSMGASTTILAAYQKPELFRGLILIESAMVSRFPSWLTRNLPKSVVQCFEPSKSVLKKPDSWESPEDFGRSIRPNRSLKRFPEETWKLFEQHGVRENSEQKWELTYPKRWEAHNYSAPPYLIPKIKKLAELRIPMVAIRGKPSVFLSQKLWSEWKNVAPEAHFKENHDYGHLFPLENPRLCASLVQEGLKNMNFTH